jgi:MFS family permease
VIAIGTLAAAVRWTTSGFAEDLRLVHLAQVLHGVTVWGIILGVPFYVDRVVPERLRATAQGMLAMVGISLGSILSNLTAGWLTEAFGPTVPARLAGVASLVLLAALPWVIPPLREADPRDGGTKA